VCKRKGGDDLDDADEGWTRHGHSLPPILPTRKNRGQQQRQQEQQMIDAAPDMPDPRAQILGESDPR
jgi:hypothetical protein